MTEVADQIELIDAVKADRILPRDNVVHIRRNANGRWVGTFVAGKCDHNVTALDEFASFSRVLDEIRKNAAKHGIRKLYYKRC